MFRSQAVSCDNNQSFRSALVLQMILRRKINILDSQLNNEVHILSAYDFSCFFIETENEGGK